MDLIAFQQTCQVANTVIFIEPTSENRSTKRLKSSVFALMGMSIPIHFHR
jgi:hypothetical protein